MINYN